jgi:hypothetical protein
MWYNIFNSRDRAENTPEGRDQFMCKKAEKAKGLTRLIRLFLDPLFWYVIMIPLAFVYVGAVEVRSDVSEFMFPILYVSEISALVSSFRIAFIRGLKFRTIICPFLLGAMMFIVFYAGNNLYAILHHPEWKISDWMYVHFAFYWFVPSVIGVIFGLVCRIFKRK